MKFLHGAIALTLVGAGIWTGGYLMQPQVEVASSAASFSGGDYQASMQTAATEQGGADFNPTTLKTFRGASVDGALRTNHKGELIVDMQLRYWIDFYLSARGEMELADIVAAMHAEMARLPQPGQGQAIDILEDYLGYLAALGEFDEETQKRLSGGDFDSMVARLEWQERLRREWMEPLVVDAFFAADESLDRYTLQRLRIQQQGGDAAALAAAEAELPEEIRQLREKAERITTMRQTEAQLRESGADSSEIQAWRVQEFGTEAAQRLAEADARKAQWQNRLREYRKYTESLADKGLGDADREQLLTAYKQRHFSEAELKRLPAALSLLAAE